MPPRSQPLLDGYASADKMYGGNATAAPSTAGSTDLLNPAVLSKADADCSKIESLISKYSKVDIKSGHMPEIQPFYAVFERQVNTVLQFVDHHQKKLEFSAKSLLTQTEKVAEKVISKKHDGRSMIMSSKKSTEELVEKCLALQAFLTKNRSALLAVSRKADAQLRTQCVKMIEMSFKSNLNSILVVVVSDIYATIRKAETKLRTNRAGNDTARDAVWEAPSSFQRNTTKYWIKEEELTKVMLTCAAEAPLLVYGKSGILTQNRSASEGDKLWDSMTTPITSVYFDAPDMSMYKKRLARLEGAQLLRARWYGNKKPQGTGIIFLELKTHHEKWVVNSSVKERAAIQERDMLSFLNPVPWTIDEAQEMILRASPKLSSDDLAKSTSLLLQMHQLVVKYKLRSCVRSVYARAAFQSPKSNDLRLTLDRNVTLCDETRRIHTPDMASWCLSDEEAATSAKAVIVPYNVFEVKLVGENPMPEGLATLISNGVIEEAPKFSKFLSGAAAFNRVSTLPYWAKHPAFATMFGLQKNPTDEPRSFASSIDQCDCYQLFDILGVDSSSNTTKSRNPLARFFNPNVGSAAAAGSVDKDAAIIGRGNVKIAEKKPLRVEPKSFFANERTYIQWISASLLLLTVSSILMGSGDSSGTAALISCSAFFLVVYATFTYFRRIKLLSSGKGRGYIDHFGPTILALGVGAGIFIVLCDLFVGSDVLAFGNRRRLAPSSPRRLMSPIFSPSPMHESPGQCFRQPVTGINVLTFKPNDISTDEERNSLFIASTSQILSHPFEGGEVAHLVHLDNVDLQGITSVGHRVFAISGGPVATKLLEFAWTPTGTLQQQAQWSVWDSATEVNGLAFVPGSDDMPGQLYIGFNDSIHIYNVPRPKDPSLNRVDSLNMQMIGLGLGMKDKTASIHHVEGVTYLLHSQQNALHAWDIQTGEFLGEIPLPRLSSPMSTEEWQGFAFERRSIQRIETSLRANKKSSELFLHLTTNAPPQVWSFAIDEIDGSRGRFLLPNCAAAGTTTDNSNLS